MCMNLLFSTAFISKSNIHPHPNYPITISRSTKLSALKQPNPKNGKSLSDNHNFIGNIFENINNNMNDDEILLIDVTRKHSSSLGNSINNAPVLVLNADYTPLSHAPLSLWSWQDALRAVFNDKAQVVSEYNLLIRSVSMALHLPSVIVLKKYHKKPDNIPVMSRRYVFVRDGFRCQYCTQSFPPSELSLDHVIPRSKGGKLEWTNTVTACRACNFKKGSSMPDELPKIGMRLRSVPREPSFSELQAKSRNSDYKRSILHPHWKEFV
eukprot:gene14934-20090_t